MFIHLDIWLGQLGFGRALGVDDMAFGDALRGPCVEIWGRKVHECRRNLHVRTFQGFSRDHELQLGDYARKLIPAESQLNRNGHKR